MFLTEWCDICCKYGVCYLYDYPGEKKEHPEWTPEWESVVERRRSQRDWDKIEQLCEEGDDVVRQTDSERSSLS